MNNNKQLKQWFLGGALICLAFSLSACAKKIKYNVTPAPQPTVAELRTAYTQQLEANGVQAIQLGETFRFVLPSDDLFNPNSANIRVDYKPTLTVLAELMNTYEKENVTVAAYTDNTAGVTRQQALTTQQAQTVSRYLWDQGIDARLEYAVGYNRDNAVDDNRTIVGRHNNRRVEVSFRIYE